MSNKYFNRFLLIVLAALSSCIGTDIEGPIPETLRISTISQELISGGSYQLNAVYTDEDGKEIDVPFTWESSDNSIFTIDNSGLLTAVSEGSGTIIVTSSGLESTLDIDILPSRASVTITNFPMQLQIGNSFEARVNYLDFNGDVIEPSEVIWSSSDESIATVSSTGEVEGISAGNVSITATVGETSSSREIEITVDEVVIQENILITAFDNAMTVGESFAFVATFWDLSNAQDDSRVISWVSSDPSILSITSSGNATAISAGTVTITATSGSVTSEAISVIVSPAAVSQVRTGVLNDPRYSITGTFTLSRNGAGDVILTVDDYTFGFAPGPYFYLSNSGNSVAGGINLGDASESRDYEFNLTAMDPDIDLNTYNWLVVWCEPFGITLGGSEFDN